MKLTLRQLKKIIKESMLLNEVTTYTIPRQDVLDAIEDILDIFETDVEITRGGQTMTTNMFSAYESRGIDRDLMQTLLEEISIVETGQLQANDQILHSGNGLSSPDGTGNVFQTDPPAINEVNGNVNGIIGRKIISAIGVVDNINYGTSLSGNNWTVDRTDVINSILNNTLYAAFYILLRRGGDGMSFDLQNRNGRSKFWKKRYNSGSGKGTPQKYNRRLQEMDPETEQQPPVDQPDPGNIIG